MSGPNRWRRFEADLVARAPGWWGRVADPVPELKRLEGVPQPVAYHAEGDVAVHTRLSVEACPADAGGDLLWAALLHDVGKPRTTRIRSDGRITAHGHAPVGAEIAREVLTRLGFPEDRRDLVVWLVKHHVFHHGWNLPDPPRLTRRQRRFVADPRFPLLLELLRADAEASLGHPDPFGPVERFARLRSEVELDPP